MHGAGKGGQPLAELWGFPPQYGAEGRGSEELPGSSRGQAPLFQGILRVPAVCKH